MIHVLAFLAAVIGVDATPDGLLKSLESTVKRENVHLVTLWTSVEAGARVGGERQTIWSDHLGRMRVYSKPGVFDADGKLNENADFNQPAEKDSLYDGEKTINQSFFPDKDKYGSHVEGGNYRSAQIVDGSDVDLRPYSVRNPLTYANGTVIDWLKYNISKGRPIGISVKDNLIKVELDCTRDSPGPYSKLNATIDQNQGGNVSVLECLGDDGAVSRSGQFSYRKSSTGNWIPDNGTYKFLNLTKSDGTVVSETQFHVESGELDDPGFDYSVFDAKLLKGTHVSDIRHAITYVVTDSDATDGDIKGLAKIALEKKQQTEGKAVVNNPAERGMRMSWIVLVNVVVLVLLVIVCFWKKKR